MIICHCNRITEKDIGDAVYCMKTNCSNPDLCPDKVYGELDACAQCCSCFPLAEKMIREAEMRFVAKDALTTSACTAFDNYAFDIKSAQAEKHN